MGLMHAVAGVAVCSRCPHLLLRVDAVDGANHSLIQLFLEPPPLRLGPAVKRTAVRSCTGYEINDSGESRLTFPVAGTDTVPVERPGENSNVCSHLSLCMRRYERGGDALYSPWCWFCRCPWSCCFDGGGWRRAWLLPTTPGNGSFEPTPSFSHRPERVESAQPAAGFVCQSGVM